MRRAVRHYMRKRPIRATLLSLVLLAALSAGVLRAADLTRWWSFTRQLQALSSTSHNGRPIEATWKFSYRGGLYPITVHIYPSELRVGRALNTAWVFGSPPAVRARYVRSLVRAQSESRLVAEFSAQLHEIASRRGLDSDRFAELAAASVQGIEYGTIGQEILLPAEMLARGKGVCTEKSVLLAALLLHEDYQTAMIVLESQHHVAVGLGSEHLRYRTLPYAFVETTRFAPIGSMSRDYLAWGPVHTPPQTIGLGGAKRYGGDRARASATGSITPNEQ